MNNKLYCKLISIFISFSVLFVYLCWVFYILRDFLQREHGIHNMNNNLMPDFIN